MTLAFPGDSCYQTNIISLPISQIFFPAALDFIGGRDLLVPHRYE